MQGLTELVAQDQLFIPVILGSIREGRRSLHAASYLASRIGAAGHASEVVDLKELALPMYSEEDGEEQHAGVRVLRGVLGRSDASMWLSPEYNHSFTGAIKNAIDHVDTELRRKPVAACGLSGAAHGGVRASEGLKVVLIEMHAVPIRDSVHFSEARHLFDADGALLRPEFEQRVDLVVNELVWYARALKWARDTVPVPVRR